MDTDNRSSLEALDDDSQITDIHSTKDDEEEKFHLINIPKPSDPKSDASLQDTQTQPIESTVISNDDEEEKLHLINIPTPSEPKSDTSQQDTQTSPILQDETQQDIPKKGTSNGKQKIQKHHGNKKRRRHRKHDTTTDGAVHQKKHHRRHKSSKQKQPEKSHLVEETDNPQETTFIFHQQEEHAHSKLSPENDIPPKYSGLDPQQIAEPSPQTIVYLPPPPPQEELVYKLPKTIILRLSITSIILGVSFLLSWMVTINRAYEAYLFNEGRSSAIWCGTLAIAGGVVGVVSTYNEHSSALNLINLVLNVILCVVCLGIIFTIGYFIKFLGTCERGEKVSVYSYSPKDCPRDVELRYFGQAILIIMAIVEFFISMLVSIFCLRAYPRCRSRRSDGAVIRLAE